MEVFSLAVQPAELSSVYPPPPPPPCTHTHTHADSLAPVAVLLLLVTFLNIPHSKLAMVYCCTGCNDYHLQPLGKKSSDGSKCVWMCFLVNHCTHLQVLNLFYFYPHLIPNLVYIMCVLMISLYAHLLLQIIIFYHILYVLYLQ